MAAGCPKALRQHHEQQQQQQQKKKAEGKLSPTASVCQMVAIPDFYKDVCPITKSELALYDDICFDLNTYRRSLGVTNLCGTSTLDVLLRRWRQPTLSVLHVTDTSRLKHDEKSQVERCMPSQLLRNMAGRAPPLHRSVSQMSVASSGHDHGSSNNNNGNGGNASPNVFIDTSVPKILGGGASVISKSVSAEVCMRIVPNQKISDIIRLFERFVEKQFKALATGNKLQVQCVGSGDWWLADPNNQFFKAAERAIVQHWDGQKPLYIREGGTLPTSSFLQDLLRVPEIHIPFGQSTDRAHLANERIRIANLLKGKDVFRSFLLNLANS
jgi:hypothetical protein